MKYISQLTDLQKVVALVVILFGAAMAYQPGM